MYYPWRIRILTHQRPRPTRPDAFAARRMPRRNSRPPPPPPYLDEDIVGQIMQHSSQWQRMQFALVCRAWARAAEKATAAAGVALKYASVPELRSVSAWLHSWGFLQIRSLALRADLIHSWKKPLQQLQLPYSSLAALTSLDLRTLDFSLQEPWLVTHSNAHAQQQQQQRQWRQAGRVLSGGSTTGITGLQQLRLSSCQLTMQDYEQLTGPASATGSLTSLALHRPRFTAWQGSGSVLSGALQHTTAVVDLQTSGAHWSSVVECLHSFKQLQRLAFAEPGGDDDDYFDFSAPFVRTGGPYAPLPASMAGLTELVVCNISAYPFEDTLWLRPALLEALPQQQLPHLQRLELDDFELFLAPSFLRLACPNLVQLVLRKAKYKLDDVGEDEPSVDQHDPRMLLPSIASLQQLQHLELYLDHRHFSDSRHPFAAHGVTLETLPLMLASRHVTELRVTVYHDGCGPEHVLTALGPGGVLLQVPQAPGLLRLSINCEGTTPDSLYDIPQHCPALQRLELHLTAKDWAGPSGYSCTTDAYYSAEDLFGLVGLASTLTSLELWTYPEPDLASVAALSSLRELTLVLQGFSAHFSKSSLQQLTTLQNLQVLSLCVKALGWDSPELCERPRDRINEVFHADPKADPISMRSPVGQMLEWAKSRQRPEYIGIPTGYGRR